MQTIGERLEEARKKKGISIREAAEATKIRGDYLSRFENNQFDINLTELYVRGFLRTYAQFLRLPADRIINDYAALGRGEARARQPSREIYGRMDVSIASADERAEAGKPAAAEDVAPAAVAPRRTTGAGRRVGSSPGVGLDPATVFKIGKWAGAGLAVILVIWALVSIFSSASSDRVTKRTESAAATTPQASTPITQSDDPTITILALDTVRLSVKVKNPDGTAGEVLLPDTTLMRGERRTVSRKTTIYLTATALQNVALEENGRTTNIKDQGITGYSRIQIGR